MADHKLAVIPVAQIELLQFYQKCNPGLYCGHPEEDSAIGGASQFAESSVNLVGAGDRHYAEIEHC